jgi:protoheme IX farnesyltransferase
VNKQLDIDAADSINQASDAESSIEGGRVTLKEYVRLAKPGILFSNSITAFGGFWVASLTSRGHIEWLLMLFTLIGTALVMASGCVLNNYLDRDLDSKMERTQNRALPSGRIKPAVVLVYGIVLGIIGLAALYFSSAYIAEGHSQPLAALLGLVGLFFYVWVYTAWFKRTSVWSTFVGSISGAVPPIIGYTAVTGTLDAGGWVLFAILFLWQPPHFWALGIRRREEYRAAGFPLLPVVRGNHITKISMIRYIILLVPVSMLLTLFNYTGWIYLIGATVLGLIWAFLCLKGFKLQEGEDEIQWAKRMFIYSINYLTIIFLLMVIDTISI